MQPGWVSEQDVRRPEIQEALNAALMQLPPDKGVQAKQALARIQAARLKVQEDGESVLVEGNSLTGILPLLLKALN